MRISALGLQIMLLTGKHWRGRTFLDYGLVDGLYCLYIGQLRLSVERITE